MGQTRVMVSSNAIFLVEAIVMLLEAGEEWGQSGLGYLEQTKQYSFLIDVQNKNVEGAFPYDGRRLQGLEILTTFLELTQVSTDYVLMRFPIPDVTLVSTIFCQPSHNLSPVKPVRESTPRFDAVPSKLSRLHEPGCVFPNAMLLLPSQLSTHRPTLVFRPLIAGSQTLRAVLGCPWRARANSSPFRWGAILQHRKSMNCGVITPADPLLARRLPTHYHFAPVTWPRYIRARASESLIVSSRWQTTMQRRQRDKHHDTRHLATFGRANKERAESWSSSSLTQFFGFAESPPVMPPPPRHSFVCTLSRFAAIHTTEKKGALFRRAGTR